MKVGTAASIMTYVYLSRIAEQLAGKLTLTVVSEEESFGPNGARHLFDACPELILGTALLNGEPSGVLELPVEWVRDDAVYFAMHRFSSLRPYTPPTDVLDIFRRELDAAWDEGGVFQLTMHPHIIGYRSRIWIVDELIRHAKAKGKVWFATHEQVARYAKEHAA